MATLLERGIQAVRNGNHPEAKMLLTQVLKQNSRNEQAWLWLSEAVDTVGEQITCIEQVLAINPDNKIAKLALKKLKAQPAKIKSSASTTIEAISPQQSGRRKPQRLSQAATALLQDTRVHHQTTASLPAMPMPELSEYMPNASATGQGVAMRQSLMAPPKLGQNPGRSAGVINGGGQGSVNLDNIPLLPAILFGTLSVTALGGLIMIGLLVAFS